MTSPLASLDADRLERVAAEAARDVDDAVGVDGRGDRVRREAGGAPALLAGGEVVAHDAVRSRDHHLRRALARDHERGRPGGGLVTVLAPALLAGRRVERDDEVGALVVPGDDERLAVDRGRGSFAEAIARLHLPELLLPEELALEVERVEPPRAEVGVEPLAVGEQRRRGVGVRLMVPSCGTSSWTTVRKRSLPSLRSTAITTNSSAFGSFATATAVVTITRSPQTIGLPWPSPGMSSFQRTFLPSAHSSGGSAVGPSPVRSGPRHSGQFGPAAACGPVGQEGGHERNGHERPSKRDHEP